MGWNLEDDDIRPVILVYKTSFWEVQTQPKPTGMTGGMVTPRHFVSIVTISSL